MLLHVPGNCCQLTETSLGLAVNSHGKRLNKIKCCYITAPLPFHCDTHCTLPTEVRRLRNISTIASRFHEKCAMGGINEVEAA